MRSLLAAALLFAFPAAFGAEVTFTSNSRVCVGNFTGYELQWSIFQGPEGNPTFAADVPSQPAGSSTHDYMCVQASYLGGPYALRIRSDDGHFGCQFGSLKGGEWVEVTKVKAENPIRCTLHDPSTFPETVITAEGGTDEFLVPSPYGPSAYQVPAALAIDTAGAMGEGGEDKPAARNGENGPNLDQGAQGECDGNDGFSGEKGGEGNAGQNAGSMYVKVDVVPGSSTENGISFLLSGWREDPATLVKTGFPASQVNLQNGQYVLLRAQGGDGGPGGMGGNGGKGGDAGTHYTDDGNQAYCAPGQGGVGGDGGPGGEAGTGGFIYIDFPQGQVELLNSWFYAVTAPGLGGVPGLAGVGGANGRQGITSNGKARDGWRPGLGPSGQGGRVVVSEH